MYRGLAALPNETATDTELRAEAEKQFRRVERLFGYQSECWPTSAQGLSGRCSGSQGGQWSRMQGQRQPSKGGAPPSGGLYLPVC
jgi:hypothetical protein